MLRLTRLAEPIQPRRVARGMQKLMEQGARVVHGLGPLVERGKRDAILNRRLVGTVARAVGDVGTIDVSGEDLFHRNVRFDGDERLLNRGGSVTPSVWSRLNT